MAKWWSILPPVFRRTRVDLEAPIREELYSVERLEIYAESLAKADKLSSRRQPVILLPRLEENGRKLVEVYQELAQSLREEHMITPAAEWLVDNFHLVEEQVREIREDLPKSYYRELPKLAEGPLKNYPRIYALSLALISHTDSHLDTETLRRFIMAYQRVSSLAIGELWAIPISLRIALVENLRRLATRIVSSREERDDADRLADKLLELGKRDPSAIVPLLTARIGKRSGLRRAFLVRLTQRLREQDPAVMQVFEWLESHLAKQDFSIERIVHEEHHRQAAAQVTVGNVITSMRLLSTLDWKEFFEGVSLVDQELSKDPAQVYSKMDFATRDRYRHVIERISKRTKTKELDIAAEAVRMAETSAGSIEDQSSSHVGYFLIGKGLAQLEAQTSYQPRSRERIERVIKRHATTFYLGVLTLVVMLLIGLWSALVFRVHHSISMTLLAGLLALIPATDLALSVLNWDITHTFEPHLLPKIDLSQGIPAEARTMVVVPVILFDVTNTEALIAKLEVTYLANQDKHLHFALLSDFADADNQQMPADEEILNAATTGVDQLNKRYSSEGPKIFHLFHRERQWCASESRWLGWERKRGKLREFNALIKGAHDTSFDLVTAPADLLSQIRYVITLDADTQLPRDAACRLIGTAIHPLNRPQFDDDLEIVVRGYGILQPRVSISLESGSRSLFARIFSGNTGIDPYTTAASDVYQDLFGEGIYTGKGLYDVDAFERALRNRAPEQTILSHDLFESVFARAALVSDIEFLDDYPANYNTYANRQHRWTRGDWQIAAWLLRKVRDEQGNKVRNPISTISKWKILDNLRRSLLAPAITVLLFAASTIFPGVAVWLGLLVLLTLAFPVYAHVTSGLLIHPRGLPWTSHFWGIWGDLRTSTAQVLLEIIFLAHQACLMTDAVARTVYRQLISRRHLLEWVTAAQSDQSAKHDLRSFFKFMLSAPAIAILYIVTATVFRPAALMLALPLAALWMASPLVAFYISRRIRRTVTILTAADVRDARTIARRTWRFFETFVGDDDHWLPPDNFQEDPNVIAHRTSPTNIGLLLLSTLSAYDFGYLGLVELVERLEFTFAGLQKLQKFRGHYFNWHDTLTLQPLWPQYVSTVDSGNLTASLIALKQGCLDLPERRILDRRILAGMIDTFAAIKAELSQLAANRRRTSAITMRDLTSEVDACAALLSRNDPGNLYEWRDRLSNIIERAVAIDDIVAALAHEHGGDEFANLRWWTSSLVKEAQNYRRDLDLFAPWVRLDISTLEQAARTLDPNQWRNIAGNLARVSVLGDLNEFHDDITAQLTELGCQFERTSASQHSDNSLAELNLLKSVLNQARESAQTFAQRLVKIAQVCQQIVDETDFKFLLDGERKVFTIGFNVTEGHQDNSYYDLLASEARMASFVAIAKGDVPQEHWFRMGRQLASVNGGRALISWTATMFEYLMPLIVMRNYDETLLAETYDAVVGRQIEYGYERGVPWGISESAFAARDLHLNYQYAAFGVPGLGLKRGLIEDLVISPYSTLLAAMLSPGPALENLRILEREGALSRYGFFEALDFTPERVKKGERYTIVRAFMAHHQGMSLIALNNLLNDRVMQNRFHSDPAVQATELLLQERIPRGVPTAQPRAEEVLSGRVVRTLTGLLTRAYETADLPVPQTQLLSNGEYSVMVTSAGSGYSICGPRAVTRWREDPTRDNWGSFVYIRDVRGGEVWSAGYQPTCVKPQTYEVAFSEDKVDSWRREFGIVTHMNVMVSAEDNAELRSVSLTNYSNRARELELTSYVEIVLAPVADDLAHPAFSNLFVETEFSAPHNALLARRRPRSSHDPAVWGVHVLATATDRIGGIQFETDRARFIGRGHNTAAPIAVSEDRPLSNTVGPVLDPIFSLRCRVRLQPNETAQIVFTTAVADSREHALALTEKYYDPNIFERESRMAWTRAQVEMTHLHVDPDEAYLFQQLGGRILYVDPSVRPQPHVLALNKLTQPSLWGQGISGDLPIVIIRIEREEHIEMARQLLRCHQYLRMKGLQFDLVVLNDHPTGYASNLQDALQLIVRSSEGQALLDKPGGIFIRRSDLLKEEERILLHAVARVVIVSDRGSLEDQLTRQPVEESLPPPFVPRATAKIDPEALTETTKLSFFNGLGGFAHDGLEYSITLGEGQWSPAPWSNVVANTEDFGFVITETGGGFTWSLNSHENRLTPWCNDPVSDEPGEVIYIRDEETGSVWTPTPLPIRESQRYLVRHGQGYTVFEHDSHGLSQELLVFCPLDAPVKISLLRLRNRTDRPRRFSVTSYNELVLGVNRQQTAPHVMTKWEKGRAAIMAHNSYNNEFGARIAFVSTSEEQHTVTCDRKEFIGRNGSLQQPAALGRVRLSGRHGAGLDPCAAIQTLIELAPGDTRQIVFLLGEAQSEDAALSIIDRFRSVPSVNQAIDRVVSFWDEMLGTIEIKTPDSSMDVLVNRWLLYQTLACRVRGRSAFYQSSGAFGFRDQLQDVMALVYAQPEVTRAQLLLAASRQFKEGDVLHWWHEPTGRGVRTRFSDDLLWLPYATSFYVNVTGDYSVLEEPVPFIEGPLLQPDQVESYLQPDVSKETATLLEHCGRAIDHSLALGAHGLPLMGSGDWNDGMNRVGVGGRGESVWLGWFLSAVLAGFIPLTAKYKMKSRGTQYREHLDKLKKGLNDAWDGDWYKRAYFDDGTPLGSAQNDECRIDSIAQTWAVISNAADYYRSGRAMAAVNEYLVRRGDGLIVLFAPAFDKSKLDPGYIKGYVPGVRENGGQYTHAALWTVIAFTMLGDGDRAGELFGLLNPINHSSTRAGLHKYKVEPYVAAGDVYAVPPHTGRGGWTWYTGSAGWMYRAALENILGFRLEGEHLRIEPCIPRAWRDFRIVYRRGKTTYQLEVENPHSVCRGIVSVEVDGIVQPNNVITFNDDGSMHHVKILMGEPVPIPDAPDPQIAEHHAEKSISSH